MVLEVQSHEIQFVVGSKYLAVEVDEVLRVRRCPVVLDEQLAGRAVDEVDLGAADQLAETSRVAVVEDADGANRGEAVLGVERARGGRVAGGIVRVILGAAWSCPAG